MFWRAGRGKKNLLEITTPLGTQQIILQQGKTETFNFALFTHLNIYKKLF
jgi:hypothetical protein